MVTSAPREAEFVSSLGQDALLFRRMQGREELGRLPEYRIELLRSQKNGPIDVEKLLGTKATVKLLLAKGKYRYFNGWITAIDQGGSTGRFDVYRVDLRPWLWHLTLGADCRIFQEKTAVEIIEAVFADYSSQQVEKKLTGSFRKRQYCVQYRESDFDFVSRLMEEEGIYYYFKHSDGQHQLVLCNGSAGHAPMTASKLGWAEAQKDDQLRDDIVTQWRLAQHLRSLKYTHTDFDHEAPATQLLATDQRTVSYAKPGDLEVFDYPGEFADPGAAGNAQEGKRLAKLRVDAFEAGHITGEALTPCRHAAAGWTFTFADHVNKGDYLITGANFEMDFGDYEATADETSIGFSCRMSVIPKKTPFAPEMTTPRAQVHGPQTATVVGPSGDELHTDKFGRVKVQFRWDRVGKKNEKSSCWVRVSHPWASKQFGMIALPRIGDEVVVEFLEGNPDRPLITGRVYNGDNMPPYELPAQATVSGIKSQSSKGGSLSNANELRFDDKKGSEYVWMQAEKDFHRLVKNDAWDTIKHDSFTDITNNRALKIGKNLDAEVGELTKVKVGKDCHVDLGADFNLAVKGATGIKSTGKVDLKGDQAISISSGQGLDVDIGQGLKLSANTTVHIKATAGVVIDGGMQLSIKAGAAFITLGPDGVSISGPLVKINSGGSAGSASAAAKASPPAPQAPTKPKESKDPLAK